MPRRAVLGKRSLERVRTGCNYIISKKVQSLSLHVDFLNIRQKVKSPDNSAKLLWNNLDIVGGRLWPPTAQRAAQRRLFSTALHSGQIQSCAGLSWVTADNLHVYKKLNMQRYIVFQFKAIRHPSSSQDNKSQVMKYVRYTFPLKRRRIRMETCLNIRSHPGSFRSDLNCFLKNCI